MTTYLLSAEVNHAELLSAIESVINNDGSTSIAEAIASLPIGKYMTVNVHGLLDMTYGEARALMLQGAQPVAVPPTTPNDVTPGEGCADPHCPVCGGYSGLDANPVPPDAVVPSDSAWQPAHLDLADIVKGTLDVLGKVEERVTALEGRSPAD